MKRTRQFPARAPIGMLLFVLALMIPQRLVAAQRDPQDIAALPRVPNMYFASGFHVSDRTGFLTFWRTRGGMLIFGYPISGEVIENGRIVQYFERARFEYYPEHVGTRNQVMLSLLGREITAGQPFPDATAATMGDGDVYFPETRHTLSGKFLNYWQKRGGLDTFGYPISEPFEEVSPIDGQLHLVQYFERARFEHHPENMPSFYQQMEAYNQIQLATLDEIQLSDLGRQSLARAGYTPRRSAPLPNVPTWSPSLFMRRIEVSISTQWLTAYEGDLPVYRAPVATGKDGFNTPRGSFAIYIRYPIQTMQGAAGGEEWFVPDIPWVQYVVGDVALHGTYWHDRWGTGVRMSHGCINLNIDDAQWLYEWAELGTPVTIME